MSTGWPMRAANASAPIPYWTANTHCLNCARSAECDAFVPSGGIAPACLPKARYGSPERYASAMAMSPESAAAIPNSCWP